MTGFFIRDTDYISTNWEKPNLQASSIHYTFTIQQKTNPPIIKGWLKDTVSSNKTLASETTSEIYIDVQTQEMSNRTSKQIKKIPVTRTKDFVW